MGAAAVRVAPPGTAGSRSSPGRGAVGPCGCREAPGGLPAPVRRRQPWRAGPEGIKQPCLGVSPGDGYGTAGMSSACADRPGAAATHYGEAAPAGKAPKEK